METVLLHIRKLRVDWLMFGAVIGLMLIGGAFVLSAAIDQYEIQPLLNSYFFRQIVFYVLGLGLAVVFVVVDYHRLAGLARGRRNWARVERVADRYVVGPDRDARLHLLVHGVHAAERRLRFCRRSDRGDFLARRVVSVFQRKADSQGANGHLLPEREHSGADLVFLIR